MGTDFDLNEFLYSPYFDNFGSVELNTITSTADPLQRAKDTIDWFAGIDLYNKWAVYID